MTAPLGVLRKLKGEPGRVHVWPIAGAAAQAGAPKMPAGINVRSNPSSGWPVMVRKSGTENSVPTGSTALLRFWRVAVVTPSDAKAPVLVAPMVTLAGKKPLAKSPAPET